MICGTFEITSVSQSTVNNPHYEGRDVIGQRTYDDTKVAGLCSRYFRKAKLVNEDKPSPSKA